MTLVPLHAHGGLYKRTVSQGNIHYSDQPPMGNAQAIKTPSAGQAETTSEARKSLNEKDQEYLKRNQDAEEFRKKAEAEAEKARVQRDNWEKSRKNLSALQNSPRTYSTNTAGQRVHMDESARASALANSEKAISEFCK